MNATPARPRCFTLIELLVVVAVIAIIAAMLLPALQGARKKAGVVSCGSMQRQAYTAMSLYGGDFAEYPATGQRATPATISESSGFGFAAFSEDGPYRLLKDYKYVTDYRNLQCSAKPFSLSDRRNGWMTAGSPWTNPTNQAKYGWGTWFGYNGPNVQGAKQGNYGSNGGLLWLGGQHPWVTESWGLSLLEDTHRCYSGYRNGNVSTDQVAFLACPGMMQATAEGTSNIIAQREPHMDSPQDLADDYGNTTNFQTDGPLWSNAYTWSVSRNYTWGDGHQVFIYRKNRAFSTSDSY